MKQHSFTNFFSKPWVGSLVLFICIVAKSVLIFFYSFVGRDKIYHLAASSNLLNGKGWTTSSYSINDLNTEILQPFCHWPPGYGLLVTPFRLLFGNDLYLSTTVFEVCCFALFLILCRGIMKSLGVSLAHRNLFTLLIAFFPYDFIEDSLGTDLPALCFMLAFVYFITKVWGEERRMIFNGVLAGLSLFLSGFIRYPYVPIGIIAPIIIIVMGYLLKKKNSLPALWSMLITTFIGIGGMMLFLNSTCGEPLVMVEAEKGIYWNNLNYSHPAAIASVINYRVTPTFIEKLFGIDYSDTQMAFSRINLLIYAMLLVAAIIFVWKKFKSGFDRNAFFKFCGITLSILIVAELALLSLTNALKVSLNGNVWTYIAEGRYHAFAIVFLQLLLFIEFSKKKKMIPTILLALMTLICAHQVYFTIKVSSRFDVMKSRVEKEQDYKWFDNYLRKEGFSSRGVDVIVASSDAFYPLIASIHGEKGLNNVGDLKNSFPKISSPTVLLLLLHESELSLYRDLLSGKEMKLEYRTLESYFYKANLQHQ